MNERLGIWGLRALALALAVALWFFLSYEKRERQSQRVVEAPVTYDAPQGMMVLDPVQQVAVRLRGGSRRIRTLNPFLVNVMLELPAETGRLEVSLGPENVFAPEGIEVVSVEPNSLHLTIDRELVRRLPVRVPLIGEPAAGAVTGAPEIEPPTVMVVGPESRIGSVEELVTRPINLDGHATTFAETTSIIVPDSLASVEPPLVRVRIPMEPPRLSDDALAQRRSP